MLMTKKEIYENIVRLSAEISKTQIAEKIFDAAEAGDVTTVDAIFDAFPEFYPELHQEIVCFGEAFNQLVGDSPEDNEKIKSILEDGENLMYELGRYRLIDKIFKAIEDDDAQKLLEVMNEFKNETSAFSERLIYFQKDCNEFWDNHKNGNKGRIFGGEADEEKGIFVFDTDIIDVLSFYVLLIMANISDSYLFQDVDIDVNEIKDEDEDCQYTNQFLIAIEAETNEAFAEFVASYNFVDWCGTRDEYSIGELLVVALSGEFDDYIDIE